MCSENSVEYKHSPVALNPWGFNVIYGMWSFQKTWAFLIVLFLMHVLDKGFKPCTTHTHIILIRRILRVQ